MVRPERLELPTSRFVVWRSIQLSYGRLNLALKALKCLYLYAECGRNLLQPYTIGKWKIGVFRD